MGHISIAAYRPKPGKDSELLEAVRNHMPVLRSQELVTDRESITMRAKDGTIVEVFEWKSSEAIEAAHTNAAVLELWKDFGEACDYVKLDSLPEIHDMFAGFAPVDL